MRASEKLCEMGMEQWFERLEWKVVELISSILGLPKPNPTN